MTPYECYIKYVSLKNHFTKKSYNYHLYKGKIKSNFNTFNVRKDKIFFEKLSKHIDIEGFLLSNIVCNPKVYIRDLAYSESAEAIYQQWLKNNQSLTYIFKQDISKITDFDSSLIVEDNSHPQLLRLFLQKKIQLETLCIILELSGAKKYWDNKLDYDPVWDMLKLKVEKYLPFIEYDKGKFKQICLDHFS